MGKLFFVCLFNVYGHLDQFERYLFVGQNSYFWKICEIVALVFLLKKKTKAPQRKQVMKGNMRGNIYVWEFARHVLTLKVGYTHLFIKHILPFTMPSINSTLYDLIIWLKEEMPT